MNEVLQTIKKRRSVRKYQAKQIPAEECESLVEAGLYCPTGGNRQPVHITVVRDGDLIARLTLELKAAVARTPGNPYKKYVGAESYTVNFGAPTFMIVSANLARALTAEADCACALENIFLAARSLGIGSCWINQLGSVTADAPFQEFLRKELGFPAGNVVYGCAALGYPEGDFPEAPPRKGSSNWVE
ncbi:MAG: nitroreductase family protein [Deltaproteobacteria bacterium]|jgi:nitroreductase|nr:nitroreductase family protein [Deltaproteobacteria bacterium]